MTTLDLLARGEVDVEGLITASSNQALLVTLRLDGEELEAVYKAERGERPLWDFPAGLWRREVAAYALSELLGFDLVPPTVAREDGPYGPGSFQAWVEDNGVDHYFTLRERAEFEAWFQRLCVFDVLANNTDRKSGHVLFDGTRCWAIDHGVCFHDEPKLRTVIWDFAGLPLNHALRAALEGLSDDAVATLAPWLDEVELDALRGRRDDLLLAGHFPLPEEDGDYPPYPWPLV